METRPDGSFCFYQKKGPIFIFHKKNYDAHCSKHQFLEKDGFLNQLEEVLFHPDVITQGLTKELKIHYKVTKSNNIWVYVMKVPVMCYRKNNKETCFIKTVYEIVGFNDQIIHPIEKRIWENSKSRI